ncbi:hypothetical protein DFA_05414 [Cavenderia fasciculata]|uniref:F-box domain-containing protein n=1 Tax=Cavenderia fasciculata TaxID=261658 RepID=F4PL60_CACFS|nr:uncharacterized protein DFA_05414 [Cavenderia fasciculata]EGG23282.1 hypothetical protein DFA_05414 [Cavenderia fasciculata]|eukprot:XP_004361133.1 hypothetical protein DFA_05414 [Cavenderia fasciculata]
MNSNINNIFVSLPDILILHIIDHMETIDRICFVLVCKRWWDRITKIMRFVIPPHVLTSKERYSVASSSSFSSTSTSSVTIPSSSIKPLSNQLLTFVYLNSFKEVLERSTTNSFILEEITDDIPRDTGITHLYLSKSLNKPIPPMKIPPSVQYIDLGHLFDQPLSVGVLPPNLVTLKVSYNFAHRLEPGDLPASLQRLELGGLYNHPLELGLLPKGLKKVILSDCYNHPIEEPGIIPEGVVYCFLGFKFNKHIPAGVLPNSVQSLKLPFQMESELVPGSVPPNCTLLSIGRMYDSPIDEGIIPDTVTNLRIAPQTLVIGETITLPPRLTHLRCSFVSQPITPSLIPPTVTHLVIDEISTALPVGGIPNSVEYLTINSEFPSLESGSLPQNLRQLILESYNHPIEEEVLPNSLQTLELHQYNYPLPQLPQSLTKLHLSNRVYSSELNLPPSIKHFTIRSEIIKLSSIQLPVNLEQLGVFYDFNSSLPISKILNTHINKLTVIIKNRFGFGQLTYDIRQLNQSHILFVEDSKMLIAGMIPTKNDIDVLGSFIGPKTYDISNNYSLRES